jgi:hypothetical protein
MVNNKMHLIMLLIIIAAVSVMPQAVNNNKNLNGFLAFNLPVGGFQRGTIIPAGASGITALVVTPKGNVFGGTSASKGKSAYIFSFNSKRLLVDSVRALSTTIKAQERIKALVTDNKGWIYGCTESWMNVDPREMRGMGYAMEYTIDKDYKGGHVFKFDESKKFSEIVDLGIPFEHQSITTIIMNSDKTRLYGLTWPGFIFFEYNLKARKAKKIEIVGKKSGWNRIGDALVLDNDGNVYGSGGYGELWKYDPSKKSFKYTGAMIPGAHGYRLIGSVDCFALDAKNNVIYGGTASEGYLFRYFPQTNKVENLGMPIMDQRMRGLIVHPNGYLYLLAGKPGKFCRFFRYNPVKGVYHEFGALEAVVLREEGVWKAIEFDAMISLADGTILMGENDTVGHLYSYRPAWDESLLMGKNR